jgi:predicted Rossmann fold flavoprotein
MYDLLVIGGGAAGFYGAVHTARKAPALRIAILEQGKQVLGKVKVSGGGRCNVTHSPAAPEVFARNYPRGSRELIGPFYRHGSSDVMAFFESLGVSLKTEADGRVFPVTNNSQTIIDHLLSETSRLGIEIHTQSKLLELKPPDPECDHWELQTTSGAMKARRILLASGSSKKVWDMLSGLGHTIVSPVPSLFTFNVTDSRLQGLQGLSCEVKLEIFPDIPEGQNEIGIYYRRAKKAKQLQSEGPLLITHWGLSGPAVLKLSAMAARFLEKTHYRFVLRINWVPQYHADGMRSFLEGVKQADAAQRVEKSRAVALPGRLWRRLVEASGITPETRWAELNRETLQLLCKQLTAGEFRIHGKSTFKEEFVTAGGVSLKQLNFKRFESKIHPGLFLAGEVLDIDAVTGGFNFQNAWTGAYLAAQGIVESLQTD